MRVVILADSFLPYISGVTTHCVELTRGLLEAGHSILLFAPQQNSKVTIPPFLESARIVYLPSFPSAIIKGFRVCYPGFARVLLEIERFRADVVQSHSPSPLGLDALTTARILRIPYSFNFSTHLTADDVLRMAFGPAGGDRLARAGWRYLRWFCNASDQVTIWTDGMRRILIDQGVHPEKIILLGPLLDTGDIRTPDRSETERLRAEYGLKDRVGIYVGRLSREKNLEDLLRAWAAVRLELDDASLLIVGGGRHEGEVRRQIKALGLTSHVVLAGPIPHEELLGSGLLNVADVFVSASASETFGLAGLEAMAHQVPVVLADSQGLSELVDGAGLLFPPGDIAAFKNAIVRILADPPLRQRMGKEAARIAGQFGRSSGVKAYLEAYSGLIGSRSRRGFAKARGL